MCYHQSGVFFTLLFFFISLFTVLMFMKRRKKNQFYCDSFNRFIVVRCWQSLATCRCIFLLFLTFFYYFEFFAAVFVLFMRKCDNFVDVHFIELFQYALNKWQLKRIAVTCLGLSNSISRTNVYECRLYLVFMTFNSYYFFFIQLLSGESHVQAIKILYTWNEKTMKRCSWN